MWLPKNNMQSGVIILICFLHMVNLLIKDDSSYINLLLAALTDYHIIYGLLFDASVLMAADLVLL